eukprot:scaffold65863_cov66-Phaeocystis_antarctica.AAC.1
MTKNVYTQKIEGAAGPAGGVEGGELAVPIAQEVGVVLNDAAIRGTDGGNVQSLLNGLYDGPWRDSAVVRPRRDNHPVWEAVDVSVCAKDEDVLPFCGDELDDGGVVGAKVHIVEACPVRARDDRSAPKLGSLLNERAAPLRVDDLSVCERLFERREDASLARNLAPGMALTFLHPLADVAVDNKQASLQCGRRHWHPKR